MTNNADSQSAARANAASSARTTRLILGFCVVAILSVVALLSRPSAGLAGQQPDSGSAARLPAASAAHRPQFTLETPSTQLVDGHLLAGHTGIPVPPAHDPEGRPSLGVLVGPALFVWVYGGDAGIRYTVVDLRGQVLAQGLTANQVYGAFPEINIPDMQFGPDGTLCEPVMLAVEEPTW